MADIILVRQDQGVIPDSDREAARRVLFGVVDGLGDAAKKSWRRFWKRLMSLEVGEIVKIEFVVPRNPKFHAKFFALLNLGFEAWEPNRKRKSYKGEPVTKNFETFRKDVTIMAGFYERTFDLNGRMKLEAKSISFSAMDDLEFEQVYSAVVDVLLEKVLITYKGREELDRVMEQMMGFL